MKNYLRGVLLIVSLALTGAATVESSSWSSEYGTCYVTCGNPYNQSVDYGMTSEQCCAQVSHLCPDSNYPIAVTWSPDEGWPIFCPPYA